MVGYFTRSVEQYLFVLYCVFYFRNFHFCSFSFYHFRESIRQPIRGGSSIATGERAGMTTPPSTSTRFPSLAAFESATLTPNAVRGALPYNLTVRSSECDADANDSSTFEIICTFPTRDRRRKPCEFVLLSPVNVSVLMKFSRYRIAVKRIEADSDNDDENATDEEGFIVVQSTPHHNHLQTHPAPPSPPPSNSIATTSRNPATNLIPPSEPAAEDSSSDSEEEHAPRRRGRRVSRTKALFEGVPTIGKKYRRKLIRPPPTAVALEEYARWEEIIGGGDAAMRLVGRYGTGETVLDTAIRKLDLALAPVKTRVVVEESEYEGEQDHHQEEPASNKGEPTNHSPKSTIPRNRNARPIHSLPTRSSNRLTTSRRHDSALAPPIIIVDSPQLFTTTIPTPPPTTAPTSANERQMEQDSSEETVSPLFSRETVDTPMTDFDDCEKSPGFSGMPIESVVAVGGSTTEPATNGLGIDTVHFPFSPIPTDPILPPFSPDGSTTPSTSAATLQSVPTTAPTPTNAISGKKGLMELCIDRKRRLSTTVRLDTKNRRCSFVDGDGGAGNEGRRDEIMDDGSWFVNEDNPA